MTNFEIAKQLADIIGLRVTEDTDGDRPIWLIDGEIEWNPVEKIEQLWPLVKRYNISIHNNPDGLSHSLTTGNGFECHAPIAKSVEQSMALAIIAANNPCREGR